MISDEAQWGRGAISSLRSRPVYYGGVGYCARTQEAKIVSLATRPTAGTNRAATPGEGPFADAQATGTDMGRDGLVIRVLSSVVSELAAGGKATASP